MHPLVVTIVMVALLALFFGLVWMTIQQSSPKVEEPRRESRGDDDSAEEDNEEEERSSKRVVADVVDPMEITEADYLWIGRRAYVHILHGALNGRLGWTAYGASNDAVVLTTRAGEDCVVHVLDGGTSLVSSGVVGAMTGSEIVCVHGRTVFLASAGRVRAYNASRKKLLLVDTLDLLWPRIFAMGVQDNGVLVVWAGVDCPARIQTFTWTGEAFLARDSAEVIGNKEDVKSDAKREILVTGDSWWAARSARGLVTTKDDADAETSVSTRGRLMGYSHWLFYDEPDTTVHDDEGEECELVSLGHVLVLRDLKSGNIRTARAPSWL